MNEEFGRTMQAQMTHFNGPSGDSLATVNAKLDDVKNVMVQNIEVSGLESQGRKGRNIQRAFALRKIGGSSLSISKHFSPVHLSLSLLR